MRGLVGFVLGAVSIVALGYLLWGVTSMLLVGGHP